VVPVRLADDTRGRVPFALVGVVLLVSSAAFAAGLGLQSPPRTDAPAPQVAAEATAVARTLLRRAAADAARDAAREPLLATADTPYGRAVDAAAADAGVSHFRAALRLRVYLNARRAFDRAAARTDGATAAVSLPDIDSPDDVETAVDSVRIERRRGGEATGERSGMIVRVRNVSLTVRRDDRVLARERRSLSVSVRSPALELHRNVTAFESRLDGAFVDDGFPARFTARLYAVAWARGYAQWGGAPIANVLANRHVGLAANAALLATQRATLGGTDPASRRAVGRAAVETGLEDLQAGAATAAPNSGLTPSPESSGGRDHRPVVAGINATADRALAAFVGGERRPTLKTVLDDVYSADVHRLTRVRRVSVSTNRSTAPANATLVGVNRTRAVAASPGNATLPETPTGYRRLAAHARHVRVTVRTERRWRRGNETWRTESVRVERYRVGVALVGRYGSTRYAPRQPFAETGDGNGTARARLRRRAIDRLIVDAGGPAALARRAVSNGTAANATRVLDVAPPEGLRASLLRDLLALRADVRNVSVRRPATAVVSGNPGDRLRARFDARREAFAPAPAAYSNLSAKAALAARRAYLARVAARLNDRAIDDASTTDGLQTALADAGVPLSGSNHSVDGLFAPRASPPAAGDRAVRTRPAYLRLEAVERPDGSRGYPLAAVNTNVFTVPYADAADSLVDALLGSPSASVRLRTAGRALRGANRTLAARPNATLREHRDRLRRETESSLTTVRTRLRAELARETNLGAGDRAAAVEAALRSRGPIHARALSAANGSLAGAVAAHAAQRGDLNATRRALLAVHLRSRLATTVAGTAVRVPRDAVNGTVRTTRSVTRRAASDLTERALRRGGAAVEKRIADRLVSVPAGLPVAPVPGHWYATVNVWRVRVRGGYRRLAVSAPAGRPVPAPNVTYVREDAPVGLDVDGDGDAERLGRNRAVEFDVRTAVVVVVPPGGDGVGDVAGADERSAGWGRRHRN
jgi:hypothetical protein